MTPRHGLLAVATTLMVVCACESVVGAQPVRYVGRPLSDVLGDLASTGLRSSPNAG